MVINSNQTLFIFDDLLSLNYIMQNYFVLLTAFAIFVIRSMTCSSTPDILSGVIIDAAIIAYIVFLSGIRISAKMHTIIVTTQIFNPLITNFLSFYESGGSTTNPNPRKNIVSTETSKKKMVTIYIVSATWAR